MKAVWIILYLMAAVAIGAVSDGLNDEGIKTIGHALGALEIAMLLSGAFVFKFTRQHFIAFMAAYIAWRIVGFDYAYNLTRGLPLLYLGNSNWWDSFFSKQLPSGVVFARMIFLALAIAVPIKHLKN